jgi:hypothetical protein
VRVIVETAIREIVLLLHRQQVASSTITATKTRLLRLSAQIAALDSAAQDTRQVEMIQGQEICRGIISDIVQNVETVICPARKVEELTLECKSLREKLFNLELEAEQIRKKDESMAASTARHQAAHEYALRSYFREVFQLRRRSLAATNDPKVAEANPDAIFDYEKYVAAMREQDADMEARYRNLQRQYEEVLENSNRERDQLCDVYKKIIEGHVRRYNALSRFVGSINDRVAAARAQCFANSRAVRATVAPIRQLVFTMGEKMVLLQQKLRVKVLQIRGLCDVLTDYTSTACRYMIDQGHSDAKMAAFSRAAFQKSLASDAADLDHVRVAKLYWRRHPVTTTIVAAIVEMRKLLSDRQDFSGKLKHLSSEFAAVQEHANNLELINQGLQAQLAQACGAPISLNVETLPKAASSKIFPPVPPPKKGENFLAAPVPSSPASLRYNAADKVMRYTLSEAQSLATNERAYVHDMFRDAERMTGDAPSWSRTELSIIRETAVRHRELVHHRNVAIIKATVIRNLRTKTVKQFSEAAKIAQLADHFTAEATTTLEEKLQTVEIQHSEEKACSSRAIVDNIVAMFMTLRTLPLTAAFQRRMSKAVTIQNFEKAVAEEEAAKLADPMSLRKQSSLAASGSMMSNSRFSMKSATHGAVVAEEMATQTDMNDVVEAMLNDSDSKYHRFLLQTTGQFATTKSNADEGDLLRIESLQPPRCIAIATTGGVGVMPTNDKSVMLMTMSSLARQRAEQKGAESVLSPPQQRLASGSPRLPPPAALLGSSQRAQSASSRALAMSRARGVVGATPQHTPLPPPDFTVPGRPPTAPTRKL